MLLQSKLSAEQLHASGLATEVAELESRITALEAQLATKNTEATDYLSMYSNAKQETAQLVHQLEEVGSQWCCQPYVLMVSLDVPARNVHMLLHRCKSAQYARIIINHTGCAAGNAG